MNLFNVNDYESDNQISALKDRIIELERQNNELSDIIIRDQSEISRLYARIQNELEPRLMAEKKYYDAFVSTDRTCFVNEKKAIFHGWGQTFVDEKRLICTTIAIIEFEDGEVRMVSPDKVRFDDHVMFDENYWTGDEKDG